MDKRLLSERDICSKFITPALQGAGWNLHTQISGEKTLTDGGITVRGKLVARGKCKRADYVLYLKPNTPIAVIEAKDNRHAVSDGILLMKSAHEQRLVRRKAYPYPLPLLVQPQGGQLRGVKIPAG